MSGQLYIYSSDATPVIVTEMSLPTTAESQVSSGTCYLLKNTGTSPCLNSTFYAWTDSKYTNTAGTPVVSSTSVVRDATGALQTASVVDETLSGNSTYTVYSSSFKAWYGGASVSVKKNDVIITSGFTLDYGNSQITFSPALTGTDVIKVSFSYKQARPGTYLLTFPTTATCRINGATAVSITADGVTTNTNVITGLSIVFSASLLTSDTAQIVVSDGVQFVEIAPDSGGSPSTYSKTGQINLGTIAASSSTPLWVRLNVPASSGTAGNTRKFRAYAESTTS